MTWLKTCKEGDTAYCGHERVTLTSFTPEVVAFRWGDGKRGYASLQTCRVMGTMSHLSEFPDPRTPREALIREIDRLIDALPVAELSRLLTITQGMARG